MTHLTEMERGPVRREPAIGAGGLKILQEGQVASGSPDEFEQTPGRSQ